MSTEKKKELIQLKVTDGLSITVFISIEYGLLASSSDIAKLLGVTDSCVRSHLSRSKIGFKQGIHFVKGVELDENFNNIQIHQNLLTIQGIVQLGLIVQSDEGLKFNRWMQGLACEYVGLVGLNVNVDSQLGVVLGKLSLIKDRI